MVRTKNPNVPLEKRKGKEIIEEDEEKSVSIGEEDSESERTKTAMESERGGDEGDTEEVQQPQQMEVESDGESEAPEPKDMYFRRSQYTKTVKLAGKCNITKTVKMIEKVLHKPGDMQWFYDHPQFKHIFHLGKKSSHKWMGMWMLLLRTVITEKKKELWFLVNGVPIRYSIREHALLSGFDCHELPLNYERKGSMSFVEKHFPMGSTISYEVLVRKMETMRNKPRDDRLRMSVLFFLASIIKGNKKTGENAPAVETFFLRAVDDLDLCLTFPWGRLSFDYTLADINHLMERCGGDARDWVFPSFSVPLEVTINHHCHCILEL